MRTTRAQLIGTGGLLAALIAANAGGCGLVLGIKDLNGDNLGGGGSGGATSATSTTTASGTTTSSSTTSSSTTSSSTTSSSTSTTSSSGGGCDPLTDCNGICADLKNDGKNCGVCGHSCQGGMCQGYQCQPVDLASGQLSPRGVAVDGSYVYFLSDSGVSSVTTAGQGLSVLATSPAAAALTMAVDATHVYWIEQAGSMSIIHSLPKTGGIPTILAKNQNLPFGLAVSGSSVFWGNADAVVTAPTSAMSSLGTTFAPGAGPWAVAADATNVYWTDITAGTVSQQSVTGAPATYVELATGQISPWGIAVDAGNVAWVNQAGTVMWVPVGGGAPQMLADNQSTPSFVAMSGSNVYWTQSNSIMKATIGGSASHTVAAGQNPSGIAADKFGVYWTTTDGFVRWAAE